MTNFRFQFYILLVGIIIASIKFGLYFMTRSNAIFSDALESLVNITANIITLYSLYLAAIPRDKSHPYGHGKAESVAAGIEGTMLSFAGIYTIYKAMEDYLASNKAEISGWPLVVIFILGTCNYLLGWFSEKKGKETNSPALTASGIHLKSDGYLNFGIAISLSIMYLTKLDWIDPAVAIVMGFVLIIHGVKVVKRSLNDILDGADEEVLERVISYLQANRDKHWIDIHNFRVQKFGSDYHIDAHLTLPYFYTNVEIHRELKEIHEIINQHFNSTVELFIHPDPCESFCCQYCMNDECEVRKDPFKNQIKWTLDNVLKNEKHGENCL